MEDTFDIALQDYNSSQIAEDVTRIRAGEKARTFVRPSLNPKSFLVVQANDIDHIGLNRLQAFKFTGK